MNVNPNPKLKPQPEPEPKPKPNQKGEHGAVRAFVVRLRDFLILCRVGRFHAEQYDVHVREQQFPSLRVAAPPPGWISLD